MTACDTCMMFKAAVGVWPLMLMLLFLKPLLSIFHLTNAKLTAWTLPGQVFWKRYDHQLSSTVTVWGKDTRKRTQMQTVWGIYLNRNQTKSTTKSPWLFSEEKVQNTKKSIKIPTQNSPKNTGEHTRVQENINRNTGEKHTAWGPNTYARLWQSTGQRQDYMYTQGIIGNSTQVGLKKEGKQDKAQK